LLVRIRTLGCPDTDPVCRPIDEGAVDDLNFQGTVIRATPTTTLPTHTLVGETPSDLLGTSLSLRGLWELLILTHPYPLAPDTDFIRSSVQCTKIFTCTPVFPGQNDRIVPSDSQRAGLFDGLNSHLCQPTDHITINQNIGF